MAALDRLDDLEFPPRAPARGCVSGRDPSGSSPEGRLHAATTIADRIDPQELGTALADAEIELVVFATDVSDYPDADETRDFELRYPARSTGPETMGRAILASAAISGLAPGHRGRCPRNQRRLGTRLPVRACLPESRGVSDRRCSDTSRATHGPTRRSSSALASGSSSFAPSRRPAPSSRRSASHRSGPRAENRPRRADRSARTGRVHAERGARGASRPGRETSVAELTRLRTDVVAAAVSPLRRGAAASKGLDARFGAARFPFRHDRHVPTLIVRSSPGEDRLGHVPGDRPWPKKHKRSLIERGYKLTDEALRPARGPRRRVERKRSAGVRAGGRTTLPRLIRPRSMPGPDRQLALGEGLPPERDGHARLVRAAVDPRA